MTEVWLLKGVTGSSPAVMTHNDGRVTMEMVDIDNERLDDKFNVAVGEITEINWPKLQMSGGCTFQVAGDKYRISFLRPQNTRIPKFGAVTGLASISGGRKAGKAWKEILPG